MGSDRNQARVGMKLDRRQMLLGAGVAGLGGALPSACCPCAATTHRWNNAIGTAGADPEHFLTPKSLEELVTIVKAAEAQRKRVRMTGSGHAFSDVAMTDDYLLSPLGLTRPLPLDRDELRSDAPKGDYVRVEAGITIKSLNQHLDAHGKALTNMGGYDAQTIVGATTTGTHGSGLRYGPLAAHIVSLEVVTTGGTVLKVEPKDGITGTFPGFVRTPTGNVPADIRRNDELFHALTVSLGCMGIVYAVVLRVVPAFWLREVREQTTWEALRAPGGFLEGVMQNDPEKIPLDRYGRPDHYEIYVSPYPNLRKRHPCLLTKRYRLPSPQTPRGGELRRGRTGGNHILVETAKITKQGQALAEFMNDHPLLVPAVIESSIGALKDDDEGYLAKSFNVFHLGPLNAMRVDGIEMAFHLDQSIRATERMFVEARTLKKDGYHHSTPPSLRFVAEAKADLAMAGGRPTSTLEMGMLVCQNGSEDLLERYEKMYIDEFQARPHWGLDHNVLKSFAEVEALYGKRATHWRETFIAMNAQGTFDGAFTDRLRISIRQRDV
jgi:hypothetical protein